MYDVAGGMSIEALGNRPTLGMGPCTVRVIFAMAVPNAPKATWVAVMMVDPNASGVTVVPFMEATLGFDEVKVHHPRESDVGGIN